MGELREVTASDGTKLAAEVSGEGNALYAVHGGPANDRRSFGDYLSPVAKLRQLCLLDQRGCGDSGDSPQETYTLRRLGMDIEDTRIALGHDRPDILGHSFGGIIALRYALDSTNTVGRVILVDASFSGLVGVLASPGAWLLWARTLRESLKRQPDWVSFHLEYEMANHEKSKEVRALLSRPIRFDKQRLGPLMMESMRSLNVRRLVEKGVRVFGIYGRQDRRFIADAHRLRRAGGQVVLIPNCGHTPFLEQPESFHATLRGFLSGDLQEPSVA